jgi:hypothetical protein
MRRRTDLPDRLDRSILPYDVESVDDTGNVTENWGSEFAVQREFSGETNWSRGC